MPGGSIAALLRAHGAHRDIAIPPARFDRHRDEVARTRIALYDAPSYRLWSPSPTFPPDGEKHL